MEIKKLSLPNYGELRLDKISLLKKENLLKGFFQDLTNCCHPYDLDTTWNLDALE